MDFWYFGYELKHGFDFTARQGCRAACLRARRSARLAAAFFSMSAISFATKGGGNIEPSGDPSDVVWGVLHQCESAHLVLLEVAKAYGQFAIGPKSRCKPIMVNSEPRPMWRSHHSSMNACARQNGQSNYGRRALERPK
jgi:hypothetical protein